MLLSNNRIQVVPFTPTKLNFYLAQIKNGSKNLQDRTNIFEPPKQIQRCDKRNINVNSLTDRVHEAGQNLINRLSRPFQIDNYGQINQIYIPSHQPHRINMPVCNSNRNMDDHCLSKVHTHNDSLDSLVIEGENLKNDSLVFPSSPKNDRKSDKSFSTQSRLFNQDKNLFSMKSLQKNQIMNLHSNNSYVNERKKNIFANDFSQLKLLPRENGQYCNNFQYFNAHKNMKQNSLKKKVKWQLQQKNTTRNYKTKIPVDQNFSQIANHISRITATLNGNSRKLEQLQKLHHFPPQQYRNSKKKLNPQQSIKRANFKYAVVDVSDTMNGRDIHNRPHVQYEDRIYSNPMSVIWHPYHNSANNKNLYSIYS